MYEVHTGEVLRRLNNRATPDDILKKIEQRVAGSRTEEYLTRCIAFLGGLVGESEIPVFYEYPLWKYPPPDRGAKEGSEVDLIYAYQLDGEWSLGIVEAKIGRGYKPHDALVQAVSYASRFNDRLLPKRIEALNDFIRLEPQADLHFHRREWSALGIYLPNTCRVTRVDILGTSGWWDDHHTDFLPTAVSLRGECEGEEIKLRRLKVPTHFLPLKGKRPEAPTVSLV